MTEDIVTFGTARRLVGILHLPARPRPELPAIVLLNAGLLHRVGPNRLYVTLARRLAALGFRVLRFDVWGIGDSQDLVGVPDGDRTFVDDTLEAFDLLQRRTGAGRFLVMGICMGAQIALEVGSRDPRVDGLVLMEGIYLRSARYHVARALDPEKWRRVLTGRSHLVTQLRGALARRLGRLRGPREAGDAEAAPAPPTPIAAFFERSRGQDVRAKVDALRARGAQLLLVFRDGNEIAYNYRLRRTGDRIVALGLPRGLEVAFIPFADHTFTPLVSQELLAEVTLAWLARHHPGAAPAAA